ncbi:TolC family protein [Sulfurirhabdus autotrophica]|uniref:Outer membrane protein TolC n=1 Tax=Sulfurirhabdus autotrophica TaxID=1706046 RepID=A0A4R3YF04_9PROT|nr:TolC family protein [Sulfurirhabdus autotrophica]TCV89053.1 outer membrane protein TolC [Sulfurirhabdus autotrophica]
MFTAAFVAPGRKIALALFLAAFTTTSYALSYDEALHIADSRASQLQAKENNVAAAKSLRAAAGELPDPKLKIGINNLPISGTNAWGLTQEPMTMQMIGLMQEVPNSDRREGARQLADANITRADTELQIERLAVKRDTASAWLKVYFLQQKQKLLDELDKENLLLSVAVKARFSAGQGKSTDTLLPRQEAATLADRRDDLERDLAKARAALSRWVGTASREPLTGAPPTFAMPEENIRHGLQHHPDLAIFNTMENGARAEVAMAQASKKPDWGVELAYQRRGQTYGDMISLQFSMDLPIFSKTRQDPKIAATQKELERITAERETMLRQHTEELEALIAESTTLSRQIERMDREWLPLRGQKVELTTIGYRAGQEPLISVLDARTSLIDTRMKRIDLEARQAEIDTKLRYLTTEKQQ